jgi:hypothetical protein
LLATIRYRAHLALTAQATAEGAGLAIAKRVANSGYLTCEERDFALDVIVPDEAAHMKWCWSAANRLTSRPAVHGVGARQRRSNEALFETLNATGKRGLPTSVLLLTHLRQFERLLLRRFDEYRAVLRTVLPEEAVSGAQRLLEDEVRHIAWGQRVSDRLHRQFADELSGSTSRLSMRDSMAHRSSSDFERCFRLAEDLKRI